MFYDEANAFNVFVRPIGYTLSIIQVSNMNIKLKTYKLLIVFLFFFYKKTLPGIFNSCLYCSLCSALPSSFKVVVRFSYLGSHARVEGILILCRAHLLPLHHLLQTHIVIILEVAHTLPIDVSLNLERVKERGM